MAVSALKSLANGDMTVVPVDRHGWPVDPGQYLPEVYIQVTLDLAEKRLAILADEFRRGPRKDDNTEQKYPGSYVHHWDFPVPVPRHMTWEISDNLSSDDAEQLLELIATQARVILTDIVPVTGRAAGGWDWTLRAAAAVRVINSFTRNPRHALSDTSVINADWSLEDCYKFRGLADLPDALAAVPELVSPDWAVMTDAELDEAAAKLARFAPFQDRVELRDAAHIDRDDVMARNVPIYLVGVLATLYRLRAEQAGTLIPVDASAWFAERTTRLTVIDDYTSDAELAKLAQAEERIAAADSQRLLGALTYLTAVRTGQRDRVRQDLAATGRRATDLGNQYNRIRSSRAALILRIDGWGDPQDGDESNRNAVLARLAGITRQAVLTLREKAHAINVADSSDQDH